MSSVENVKAFLRSAKCNLLIPVYILMWQPSGYCLILGASHFEQCCCKLEMFLRYRRFNAHIGASDFVCYLLLSRVHI